jgi:hypothetical protein
MTSNPNRSPQKPAASQNKKGCLIASVVGGCAAFLGVCAILVVAYFVFDPFGEEIVGWPTDPVETEFEIYAGNDDVQPETMEENYALRRIRSAETTPEMVEGITGGTPMSLTLSDNTRLDLPATTNPVGVWLARESSDTQLNQPGLETSGSTRVVAFDLNQVGEDFIPTLTIPAWELGELHPATVNIARVGPLWVDGEIYTDQITFLPLTLDSNGDIVIVDSEIAGMIAAVAASTESGGAKMAAQAPQYGDGRFLTVKYVPMTFQTDLDWYAYPRLVRMIPDADFPGYRRPANMDADIEALQKPISNMIVLVHGHNEEEKDGSAPATTDEPWNYAYKQEAWNEYYKTFLETQADQVDCTAFYEFIYPTFRSAYSPIEGNPVEPLGDTFAKALRVGAKNDGYQIKRMREANMPVNVFITAHSMGGLVARAGIRQFDEYMQDSFQQLVTWGTPHHGSPLVTLGYIFRGAYMVNPGQLRAAHWFPSSLPEGDVNTILGSGMLKWILDLKVQLDTPGTRDLRWDNVRPLRLDEIFMDDTRALIFMDPGNTSYNLVDGAWLYNDNLKKFNDSDPYYNSDKYVFLYGTTSKRLPDQSGETAIGATILPTLLKDAMKTISDSGGERAEGESDGAVPLVSMAGMGIAQTRYYIGDVDHEEYYSSAGEKGRMTARATFNSLGLDAARCACARVVIENAEDLNVDRSDGQREIYARLILDAKLAPSVGKQIEKAEAILYRGGNNDRFETLGELTVTNSGEMQGTFSMPEETEEEIRLVVRVFLRDGTQLDSEPVLINEAPCLPHPGSIINICTCNDGTRCWWNGVEAMCSDTEPPAEWYCAPSP